MWIWHDSGRDPGFGYPAPYGGFNHDEFLIFRIAGNVPEPASIGSLVLGGLMLLRLRRV
jgi:hypothetical protein